MAVKKETTKKETKPKPIAKAKEVEKVVKEEIVEVKAKRSKKELRTELKKLKNDIEVEILNLSTGRVCFIDKDGDTVFDLNKHGEKETIELEAIYKIASKNKGFFEKHYITITDVDNDDFEIEDILEYLNIKGLYDKIENYDTDYIQEMLMEMDDYDFEKVISISDVSLVERLADRARNLYKVGKFDSMSRAKVIADRLKIDDLFDLV